MTAGQNLNERIQHKNEFFHLEDRASDHPFVERVWRCHTDRGDMFLSVAANCFEMILTRLGGRSLLTLQGPETAATTVDCPAEGQWIGIRFKPGIFMPRFLPGSLRDHNNVTLPPAAGQSFWLNGSALEYPSFDNAESLVKRLAKSAILSRDPSGSAVLEPCPGGLCPAGLAAPPPTAEEIVASGSSESTGNSCLDCWTALPKRSVGPGDGVSGTNCPSRLTDASSCPLHKPDPGSAVL